MSVHFTAASQTYSATNGALGTNLTYCGWAYLDAVPNAYSMIFAAENAASNAAGFAIGLNDSATPTLQVSSDVGGVDSGVTPTIGTWYCIAAAVTGTSCTLYWGTSPAALSSASGSISSSGRTFMRICSSSYAEWWQGRSAAVKVWSAVLTQAEIQAELTRYAAVRTANLVRVHRLQVPEVTDYSGNGNVLTGGTGAGTTADPPIGPFSPPYPGLLVSRLRPYFG